MIRGEADFTAGLRPDRRDGLGLVHRLRRGTLRYAIRFTPRRGLTLIELLIVLVILISLAAILSPLLSSVVRRAHGSSGGESIREIVKAIQMYESLYGRQPDYYDSLLLPSGMELAINSRSYVLLPRPVDERTGDALQAAGIQHTWKMAISSWPDDTPQVDPGSGPPGPPVPRTNNATMNPYYSAANASAHGDGDWIRLARRSPDVGGWGGPLLAIDGPTRLRSTRTQLQECSTRTQLQGYCGGAVPAMAGPVSVIVWWLQAMLGQASESAVFEIRGGADPTGYVAWLSDIGIEQLQLELPTDTPMPGRPFRYVAFGLGARCTAIGKTMAEAPIHFGQDPVKRYSRFLVVYEIPGTGPARLAAVAALDDDRLSGTNLHVQEFYEAR